MQPALGCLAEPASCSLSDSLKAPLLLAGRTRPQACHWGGSLLVPEAPRGWVLGPGR